MASTDSERHSWLLDKLGMISASNAYRWCGGAQARETFARELAAQTLSGAYAEVDAPALIWGRENEEEALAHWGEYMQPGFIHHPDFHRVGCTPDAVVLGGDLGDDRMEIVQVKCPHISTNFVKALLEGPDKDYVRQVQVEMWVSEAVFKRIPQGVVLYYDPRFPTHLQRKIYEVELTDDHRKEFADAAKACEKRFLEILNEIDPGTDL